MAVPGVPPFINFIPYKGSKCIPLLKFNSLFAWLKESGWYLVNKDSLFSDAAFTDKSKFPWWYCFYMD